MSSRNIELTVRVSGDRVGTIRGGPGGRVRFVPDSQWIAGGQQPRLGWPFLVDEKPRDGGLRLPAWFENLLPESGSPLRARVCREHDIGEHDGPRLLGALGGDLVGAVTVEGWVDPYGDSPDREEPIDRTDTRLHFSVPGMQPKLSMQLHGEKGWTLPGVDGAGDWLVKFAARSLSALPAVEYATMTWAAASGFEVPQCRMVNHDEFEDPGAGFLAGASSAFAIKRFDRTPDGRIHQEDLAQALEIQPYDKFGGPGRLAVSYDSLARFFLDACGEDGQRDFVERVAFVIASGNDDAHLKNWSIQWEPGKLRPTLAPCYDQVCTIAWPEFGWSDTNQPELALPFGGRKSWADLDGDRVTRFAARANNDRAGSWLRASIERIRDAWPSVRAQAPEAMRQALVEHWRRVPLLAQYGELAM